MSSEALSRLELLLGGGAVARLAQSAFLVCGLGGVGSWAAEALGRSGVGALALADFDTVKESNLNRQLVALRSTVGRLKAEVMAERLLDIQPRLEVEVVTERLTPENVITLLERRPHWDGVLDAIDERSAKLALLEACVKRGIPVVSSMGAANKISPEQITVADLSKTSGCPFAKLIRKEMRRRGITHGITCVYSPELPVESPGDAEAAETLREAPGAKRPLGSMVTVTAIFGMRCAQTLLENVTGSRGLPHRGGWRRRERPL
ncbi:MAG: tRNA threonylcarbamoyladenosine dehydratase [Victivallales bacterium]|nr:tRNA threonylcarbamoyladenosine dehydratase [Victivallales bacterium]